MTNERDTSRDTSQPEPLSTPDCDLRGLEWMPLNAADLLDSTLFLESSGDEFKAAMALICKSWRQVPAGSLPNSDNALATLSMARDWTSVRTMALRNWVLCSDGRLYHPIVAAKAMEALPHRQEFVANKTASALRKERERNDRKELFALLRAHGVVMDVKTKTAELRETARAMGLAPSGNDVTPQKRDTSRDMSRLGQGQDTTPQGQKEGNRVGAEPGQGSGEPGKPAARAAATRGHRLSPEWQLPKAWGDWALAEYPQWTEAKVRREAANFRDHWVAKTGKDATKLDWLATWRTWCRNPLAHRDDPKPGTGSLNRQEQLEDSNLAAAAAFAGG